MEGIRKNVPIRVLLADDEQPARDRLKHLLSRYPDLSVVAEAGDGEEAVLKISQHQPDVVFLDVQMPGKSGLEVAAALTPPRPALIFCTAFDRYAVRAFDHHAIDYLMKPVSRARLEAALGRIRERISALTPDAEFRADLLRAEETQSHLFPKRKPKLRTLEYSGICRAAQGVGGDYYDFLEVSEGCFGVALADVSGKGIAAALLMASLQGHLRSRFREETRGLNRLLGEMNRSFCEATSTSQFASFFYGVYEERTRLFRYCNGGHLPPLLFRRSSNGTERRRLTSRLDAGGPVLGVLPEAAYQEGVVELQAGDVLALYSDGVTEAMNGQDEEFGEERLIELLRSFADLPPEEMAASLLAEISSFAGGEFRRQDDLTLILLRVLS